MYILEDFVIISFKRSNEFNGVSHFVAVDMTVVP
jgi:hypothetical protein